MKTTPCSRCLTLLAERVINPEMVQRLPDVAPVGHPVSVGVCCHDCAAADSLAPTCGSFEAARVAVGNDRVDSYRWPPGMKLGLILTGHMRLPVDTLADHQDWLDEVVPGWSDAPARQGRA